MGMVRAMNTPQLQRLKHQLAPLADLPVVSTVIPLVEAPFAHRHRRRSPWSWRPSTRQAVVVLLLLGVGAIVRNRRMAANDRRATDAARGSNGSAYNRPSEDRTGTWADDGGAAPGHPGDDSSRLSSSPTGPPLHQRSR